ncbi:MAG TPA: TetR/AcrR family transcriptional regulator [Acidimicrobiales bacterium]|nr:TetR/AcrR family transcriptional regulator [Acidimicrobiales bacterium]
MTPSGGARERARAEITAEIKEAARRRIALDGAPALSLRAVARDLGFVSSAIYRYFASRDELLTALIVDAYDDLGTAAEAALGTGGPDPARRWLAVAGAVRDWALEHRHEYALLYGSPVPGYRAPELTVGPASRVTLALASVVASAAAAGRLEERPVPAGLSPGVLDDARRIRDLATPGVSDGAALRTLVAWNGLFGMVSFELFGHTVGVVEDRRGVFEAGAAALGWFVGLAGGPG